MAEPKLRFRQDGKKFQDWHSISFDKLFKILNNNTLSRDYLNYEKGVVKNIHYGDVLVNYDEICDIRKHSVPFVNDNICCDKYEQLQDGDIILADTAEDSTVGKAIEIQNIGTLKVVSGLHTIPCRPLNYFAPNYLGYFINSDAYHRQLIPIMQGTKVTSINRKNITKTVINYPSDLEEQQKIASFFSNLDEVITQSQAEVESLEKLKKGAMQKIFSQEVRFKADDGSEYAGWEVFKLSDLFFTRNGYTPSKKNSVYWKNGTIPWYRMEDIRKNGSILYDSIQHISDHALKGLGCFPSDTIIFATSATVGEHAILKTEALSNQRFTAIIPKENYKSKLLPMFVYFVGFQIDDYCLHHQSLGTMPAVDMNAFKLFPFPLPCLEEQQKIADFLSSFDTAIDLAKQELEKWQLLKKGFMQQMFV